MPLRLCGEEFAFAVWFVATAAQAALPIQHWQMDNGVRVYFVENHDLPLLDISVEFPAGSSRDDKSRPGLASMTHHLLTLGAGGMTEEEISRRMADIGASLGGSFDQDRAGLRLRTLSSARERDQALEIMAKSLQSPGLPRSGTGAGKNPIHRRTQGSQDPAGVHCRAGVQFDGLWNPSLRVVLHG